MYESFVPFGPLIYRADIRGEFNDFLLKHLDSVRDSRNAGNKLAGNIEEQRYAPYPEMEFMSYVDYHILNYLRENYKRLLKIERNVFGGRSKEFLDPNEHKVRYHMGEGPWVNFSSKGDYNPMHNHSGIISAVVFIDIPDKLEEERENSTYPINPSGCLEFVNSNCQHILVKPRTGTLYLFPSYQWHLVYPYRSDVERISMSFNIYELKYDDKLQTENDFVY